MQKCGVCTMLSGILRRAMCIGSRRGSSESYYRELGDQDTLKVEDKTSEASGDSEGTNEEENESTPKRTPINFAEEFHNMTKKNLCTGKFLTLHKRRRKRLLTRSLYQEAALLDDLHPGQVKRILSQAHLWKFNAFTLENLSGGRCLPVLCIHLFHVYGLLGHFKLDVARAWKLFSLIEEGYHGTNPYHNSVHAADVTQAMHCFLQQKEILKYLDPLEIMASLLAAIAHDVDHPGVNQPFLIATSNHLAALYHNTSVLENHHWRSAISCIIESGLLEPIQDLRGQLEHHISSLILATDITRQQEYLGQFKGYLDTNTLDLTKHDHRHLVLQMALKCADISNPCRPWDISRKWSLKVCDEFFRQGDYERKLNLPVTALCDRHTTSIPKIQTGFLKYVVTPLITEWHRFLQNDLSSQMLENLLFNQNKWETLLAQEIADETKTEISDADMVDEDFETCSGTNISNSSEYLLPLRKGSLVPVRQKSFKNQLRRFSVPLNVFQDARSRSCDKTRASSVVNSMSSEHSIHSQLSVCGQCKPDEPETIISTEHLLLETSIASITTPAEASRLCTVLRGGGNWRLVRQHTFPPLELNSRAAMSLRPHHLSEEGALHMHRTKTDISRLLAERTDNATGAKNDDKTDIDDASDNVKCCDGDDGAAGTRDVEVAGTSGEGDETGNQFRDNMVAVKLGMLYPDDIIPRRKSVPADADTFSTQEAMVRELASNLPQFLRRTISGREYWIRRGSAPAPVSPSELKGLSGVRTCVNAGRRKPSQATTCHLVIRNSPGQNSAESPRRGSLPVEVMAGTSS